MLTSREAELLVVVGTDPLGRVDRALFQRRIDIAAGDLLRHDAQLGERQAAGSADAHLQPLQVRHLVDGLPEPAAHLAAGVARRELDDVVLLEELAHQLEAPAVIHPGVLLARVQSERDRTGKRERGVFAEIVIGRGVAAFDGRILHGVEDLQPADDFAGGEHLDVEPATGRGADALADQLRAAIQRVEALGPARRQPPVDRRQRSRLRPGLRRQQGRARRRTQPGGLDEIASFHLVLSSN